MTLLSYTPGAAISIVCFTTILIFHDVYSRPLSLTLTFCVCTINQFVDYHPMAQKLASSLVILNFVSVNTPSTSSVWTMLIEVAVGVACAMIGVILPYPHLASTELESQVVLTANGISSCFDDTLIDWLHRSVSHLNDGSFMLTMKRDTLFFDREHTFHKRSRWKRILLVVRAIFVFNSIAKEIGRKREKGEHIISTWEYLEGYTSQTSVRKEVLVFLDENLSRMSTWVNEAKFGPSFVKYLFNSPGKHYLHLVSNCLILLATMESKILNRHRDDENTPIYYAFNNRPDFRRTLRYLGRGIGASLVAIAHSFVLESDESREYVSTSLLRLKAAQEAFNIEYEIARQRIYYSCHGAQCLCSLKPLVPEVFLQMNSFLFLLDAACTHIFEYWRRHALAHGDITGGEEMRKRRMKKSGERRYSLLVLLREIFPEQRQHWTSTEQLKARLGQSVVFSLSVVLAGVYGLYSTITTEPSLVRIFLFFPHLSHPKPLLSPSLSFSFSFIYIYMYIHMCVCVCVCLCVCIYLFPYPFPSSSLSFYLYIPTHLSMNLFLWLCLVLYINYKALFNFSVL